MNHFRPIRRRGLRRGVSLMEVLFSVGIIMVGLVGVAVLVPAAGRIAQKGNALDHASRSGQNWLRDIETRGYMRPGMWVLGDAASTAAYQNDVNGMGAVTAFAHEKSFCIDPRYVATQGDSYFPYPTPATDPRMRRITLRRAPGSSKMLQDQADELFMSRDDLLFTRPSDATLAPVQVYGSVGGGKRQTDSRISYMVTVVPKLQGSNRYRDLYTVSTVVFNSRDPAMSTASRAPERDNERYVEVSGFYGSTGGGGDAQVGDLQLRALATRSAAEAQADLDVHRGDWLMLSGNTTVYAGYNAAGVMQTVTLPVFRWYRVVQADVPQFVANRWVVDVTLHGPDWNSNISTHATIMTDVVAVYEKTMRLENSSLWTR